MIKHPNGRGRTGKPRGGHLLPDGSREHRYSRELAEEICRRIAAGETLTEICIDPAIPVSAGAVRQWDLDDRDGWFSETYARARRQQIEAWSDQLVAIADDSRLEPNDRRVRLDTRKWLMSKLHPQRYGDKVQVAGIRIVRSGTLSASWICRSSAPPNWMLWNAFTDARLAAKNVQDKGV